MSKKKQPKKAIKSNKKKTPPKFSKSDCPDGVCPIKKKAAPKKTSKKLSGKSKDINVVVPIPAPIPISVPITIPTGNGILGKIKNVFSVFGLYRKDS
jgi:hypothetical protein